MMHRNDESIHVNGRMFNLRLTPQEEALLESFKARLIHHKYGKKVRVTYKTVILEALDALELSLNDMDRIEKRDNDQSYKEREQSNERTD